MTTLSESEFQRGAQVISTPMADDFTPPSAALTPRATPVVDDMVAWLHTQLDDAEQHEPDPAQVLADIASKRAIIHHLTETIHHATSPPAVALAHYTLGLLAAGLRDRPGFDERWCP